MLFKVLERLDSVPEQGLMTRDTDNDMLAGKNAGMATCAVTYGYFSREELEALRPSCMIDSPLELLDVLDGYPREGG
jgi:phosphoglycolate phosphatase